MFQLPRRAISMALVLLFSFYTGSSCYAADLLSESLERFSGPNLRVSPLQQRAEAPEKQRAVPEALKAPVKGSISLGENPEDALNAQQIALIEDYFFYYFESLALLEPQDVSLIFAEDGAAQAQAAMHTATFEVLTETRKMQPVDLRLVN